MQKSLVVVHGVVDPNFKKSVESKGSVYFARSFGFVGSTGVGKGGYLDPLVVHLGLGMNQDQDQEPTIAFSLRDAWEEMRDLAERCGYGIKDKRHRNDIRAISASLRELADSMDYASGQQWWRPWMIRRRMVSVYWKIKLRCQLMFIRPVEINTSKL